MHNVGNPKDIGILYAECYIIVAEGNVFLLFSALWLMQNPKGWWCSRLKISELAQGFSDCCSISGSQETFCIKHKGFFMFLSFLQAQTFTGEPLCAQSHQKRQKPEKPLEENGGIALLPVFRFGLIRAMRSLGFQPVCSKNNRRRLNSVFLRQTTSVFDVDDRNLDKWNRLARTIKHRRNKQITFAYLAGIKRLWLIEAYQYSSSLKRKSSLVG